MKKRQHTILVVDDNMVNLRVMTTYLEHSGFDILLARDGEQGLTIARREQPDLILLDAMMPGMDGFETCRQLKTIPQIKDIPVIFMTALTDEANKLKGFEAGAVDYITKPVQLKELLGRVDIHLRLREQARSLESQNLRLEISQQISQRISSILDLNRLLLEIVQLVQQKFNSYYVAIWFVQTDQMILKAEAGQHLTPLVGRKSVIPLNTPQSIVAHVGRTGQVYLANDVAHDPIYQPVPELAQTQAELTLPLFTPEQVIGVLDLQSEYLGAFTPDDMTLLQTIASQVSLAVTNSVLFEQNQVTLRETELLFKAAQAILGANDLERICQKLVDYFNELIGSDGIALYLVDHKQAKITLTIAPVISEPITYADLTHGIVGLVFNSKEPLISAHADDGFEPETSKGRRKYYQIGPLMVVPLVAQGEVIGVIIPVRKIGQPTFTSHDLDLLMALTTQAAAAIENVRLFQAVKEANELLEQRVQQRTQLLELQAVELREARMKAEAANRAKSEFLSAMSHELRTPLNAVIGFSQLMQRDAQITSNQTKNLQIIKQNGEHLLRLINDVLDMSKIEAGQVNLHENDFDLLQFLDKLIDMFRLRTEAKGVRLIFNPSPDLPPYIRADEGKLQQVLSNLLSNAVKFTQVGEITLEVLAETLSPTQTRLFFRLTDTGYGIGEAELGSLFEAFVQTESGHRVQQGTGLGLAISYKFVQLMGGELQVTSQLGQGSCFSFDLVVQVVALLDTKPVSLPLQVLGLEPNQPPCRLLVVDDQLENRVFLAQLLQQVGFEVAEATNGAEALTIWERWQPHLIWMDLRMPVMDGYQATQAIKGTAQGKDTVVIAFTASALEQDRLMAEEAGCDDFLSKPIQEATIFAKIAQHVGVRYRYETATSMETSSANGVWSWEQVPLSLIESLEQSAIEGKYQDILAVIEQIQPYNERMASHLTHLVDDFAYDEIIALCETTPMKE